MDVFVRANESCSAQPLLLWDTVWNAATFSGDWALAGQAAAGNSGGLQATAALATAVILALWTDKRCPPDHPLAAHADPSDLRGWWGDGVDVRTDLGEGDLGSLLWLLERWVATPAAAQWAEVLAQEALLPLVTQGVVAKVAASASVLPARNGLSLDIALYGRDGAELYNMRFDAVWRQLGNGAPRLPGAPLMPPQPSGPPGLPGLPTTGGGTLGPVLATDDGAIVTTDGGQAVAID